MRYSRLSPVAVVVLTALTVLAAASCGDSDSTGPGSGGGEVRFGMGDVRGEFSAAGDLVLDGGRLDGSDWAVAADPDSVGGIVVTAFDGISIEGTGDLFILQLQPARVGAFPTCGPNEACRGRLFMGLRTDLTVYDDWLEITAGSVEVEELTSKRVRGTFTLTFTNGGGAGSTDLYAFGGRFDVPFDDRAGGIVCGLPPSVGCLSN